MVARPQGSDGVDPSGGATWWISTQTRLCLILPGGERQMPQPYRGVVMVNDSRHRVLTLVGRQFMCVRVS